MDGIQKWLLLIERDEKNRFSQRLQNEGHQPDNPVSSVIDADEALCSRSTQNKRYLGNQHSRQPSG